MKNIAKTIDDYIKQNISNVNFYNDLFPDATTEGIISIHDPSSRIVADYIDGTKEYAINISFTSRFKKASDSRAKLDAILDLLNNVKLTDITDNLQLKCKAVANVQFIGTDDKGNALYTCSISVNYIKLK